MNPGDTQLGEKYGRQGWAWDGNQWLRPGYGGNGA